MTRDVRYSIWPRSGRLTDERHLPVDERLVDLLCIGNVVKIMVEHPNGTTSPAFVTLTSVAESLRGTVMGRPLVADDLPAGFEIEFGRGDIDTLPFDRAENAVLARVADELLNPPRRLCPERDSAGVRYAVILRDGPVTDYDSTILEERVLGMLLIGHIVRVQVEAPVSGSIEAIYVRLTSVEAEVLHGEILPACRSTPYDDALANGSNIEFVRGAVTEIPLSWRGNETLLALGVRSEQRLDRMTGVRV